MCDGYPRKSLENDKDESVEMFYGKQTTNVVNAVQKIGPASVPVDVLTEGVLSSGVVNKYNEIRHNARRRRHADAQLSDAMHTAEMSYDVISRIYTSFVSTIRYSYTKNR